MGVAPLRSRVLFVAAEELIPADQGEIAEGTGSVEGADFGAFDVVPVHRDLHYFDAVDFCDDQILDVEAEAVQNLTREDNLGGIAPEELEAALRIPKGQAGGGSHDHVEQAAGHFAKGGLVYAYEGAVERARSDGDGSVDVVGGGPQGVDFFDGAGEVGVGGEDPIAGGFAHAVADGVAFAAIAGIPEQLQKRMALGMFLDQGSRGVTGAVVDDENFGLLKTSAEIDQLG